MLVATLALALATATPSTVYYASPDAGPSALCDCVQQLRQPGDECRLRAGRYEIGAARCEVAALRGTEVQPVRITSAGDGDVVIDGTLPIAGPWTASTGGHYAAPRGGHKILQLFIDGELQPLRCLVALAVVHDRCVQHHGVLFLARARGRAVHRLPGGECAVVRFECLSTNRLPAVRLCGRAGGWSECACACLLSSLGTRYTPALARSHCSLAVPPPATTLTTTIASGR